MGGKILKALLGVLVTLVVALGLVLVLGPGRSTVSAPAAAAQPPCLGKQELAPLVGCNVGDLLAPGGMAVSHPELGTLRLRSTIDPQLQAVAEKILTRQGGIRSSMVLVDAHSGRVLVLAGARGKKMDPSLALDATAPAASLFKLITAAAALEETPLKPASKLSYCGRGTTLYRYQVGEKLRRWVTETSLAKAFAHSNNPLFGRLGVLRLGEDTLVRYAHLLGFTQPLHCEAALEPNFLLDPDDDYSVAELASGFNRVTTISPLHAALLVSAFLNNGRMPQPYIVSAASDDQGRVVYVGRPELGPPVVGPQTCLEMQCLLQETIRSGTARKSFRNRRRDSVLKHLELGGKTGTIRGPNRSELYQWFAGYGADPVTGRVYAVAVLTVHGKVRQAHPGKMAAGMLKAAFGRSQVASR